MNLASTGIIGNYTGEFLSELSSNRNLTHYPRGFYVGNAMDLPDTAPIEIETTVVIVTNPTRREVPPVINQKLLAKAVSGEKQPACRLLTLVVR